MSFDRARVLDLLLAASVVGWSINAVVDRSGSLWIWTFVVHATVAGLIAFRRRSTQFAGLSDVLVCLPSLTVGAAVVFLGDRLQLSPPLRAATVVAALWILASYLSLGRSFGVLPADRGLVRAGPYRLVRHPAYLGHVLMAGCLGAAVSPVIGLVAAAGLALCVVPRLKAEEARLGRRHDYAGYVRTVRFRLIPGVW